MPRLPKELAELRPPEPSDPQGTGALEPPNPLLRLDAQAVLGLETPRGIRVASLPSNATSDLAQLEIADRMRSTVERLRRRLYLNEDPPFPCDYAAARADMLERIGQLPAALPLDPVAVAQLRANSDRLRGEVDALGLRLAARVEAPRLQLIDASGDVTSHPVRAAASHPLRELADSVEELGRRERIAPARVLAHVLTGEPLNAPRAILVARSPVGGGLTQLEIQFLVADATREDFVALQQLARDLLGGGEQRGRAAGLNENDLRLLEVVRELGHSLDQRAPRGFWARVAERVAELTQGNDTPSSEALRLRAIQLREKLQRLRATEDSETE